MNWLLQKVFLGLSHRKLIFQVSVDFLKGFPIIRNYFTLQFSYDWRNCITLWFTFSGGNLKALLLFILRSKKIKIYLRKEHRSSSRGGIGNGLVGQVDREERLKTWKEDRGGHAPSGQPHHPKTNSEHVPKNTPKHPKASRSTLFSISLLELKYRLFTFALPQQARSLSPQSNR